MKICCALKIIKFVWMFCLFTCGCLLLFGCASQNGIRADEIKIEICVPNSWCSPVISAFIKTNVCVCNQHDVLKAIHILESGSKPFDENKRIFFGYETVQVFERNGIPYMITTICANGEVRVLRELDVYKSDLGYVLYGFKKLDEYDNYFYYKLFHDYFEAAVDSNPEETIAVYKGRAKYNLIRSIMREEGISEPIKRDMKGGL